MKILHLLYQSLPEIAGTSIRGRDILVSQKAIGLEPVAVTSPFQPGYTSRKIEYIYGIKHYRTNNPSEKILVTEGKKTLIGRLSKAIRFISFFKLLLKYAVRERPSVIHAHSTFFMGFAGKFLSLKYRRPFVYEVRSLWDERQKQYATTKFELLQLGLVKLFENAAMLLADRVVVINENLLENIKLRGVNTNKISLIRNAVNLKLIEKANITYGKRQIRFGYIGSITRIEGLDFLIDVFVELSNQGFENILFIYGVGHDYVRLKQKIERLNIHTVKLMGSVSPKEVSKAYNEVDVIINPRIKNTLTDNVTPLKPFEAMGYKKLFVGSHVGGIKELVENEKTGLLFEAENKDSLVDLISNKILKKHCYSKNQTIIQNGFEFVNNYYSWENNAKKYRFIYSKLAVKQ